MRQNAARKLYDLPEPARQEANDFIDFLYARHVRKKICKPFQFNWEGGLNELKVTFSAVELQHKALEWR